MRDIRLIIQLVSHPEFNPDDLPHTVNGITQMLASCIPTCNIDSTTDTNTGYKGSVQYLPEVVQRKFLANPVIAKEMSYNPVYLYEDNHDPFKEEMSINTKRLYAGPQTADRFHLNDGLTKRSNSLFIDGSMHTVQRGDYVLIVPNVPHSEWKCQLMLVHHFADVKHIGNEDSPAEQAVVGYYLPWVTHVVRHPPESADDFLDTRVAKTCSSGEIDYSKPDNLRLGLQRCMLHVMHIGESYELKYQSNPALGEIHHYTTTVTLISNGTVDELRPSDLDDPNRAANAIRGIMLEIFKDGSIVHSFKYRGVEVQMVRLKNCPFYIVNSPAMNVMFAMSIPPKGKRKLNPEAIYQDMKSFTDNMNACVSKHKPHMLFDAYDGSIVWCSMDNMNILADSPEAWELTQSIGGGYSISRILKEYSILQDANVDLAKYGIDTRAPPDMLVNKVLDLEERLYRIKRQQDPKPNSINPDTGKKWSLKDVRILKLPNPNLEVDPKDDFDIMKSQSFGIMHSKQNFANQRVQRVVVLQMLKQPTVAHPNIGVAIMQEKYNRYADSDSLRRCSLCELNCQAITQYGRIKFQGIDNYLNVMHAVFVDTFHPKFVSTKKDFDNLFVASIANKFETDSDEDNKKRADFQLSLIQWSEITVQICNLMTSSVISQPDIDQFKELTKAIVVLTKEKIDPVIGKVYIEEEDDDAMRRPVDFGDDTDVTSATSGIDRGTIPTSGVLCTPTVRNLFSEWIRKVRELGSFVYGSEIAGEHNQGDVEDTAYNTSSRENTMHKEMMNTQEGRTMFRSYFCGSPYTMLTSDIEVFDPKEFPGETVVEKSMNAGSARLATFVAAAYLGQLSYPGSRLVSLSKHPEKVNPNHRLMKLLQEKLSHSMFSPPEQNVARLFGAERKKTNKSLFNRKGIDLILSQLLEQSHTNDMPQADITRINDLIKEFCIINDEYKHIFEKDPCRFVLFKRLVGKNASISPGDFIQVKFIAGMNPNNNSPVVSVGLAQFIGSVAFAPKSKRCDTARTGCAIVCWFEPYTFDDQQSTPVCENVYGYPEYMKGNWDVIPPNSIIKMAHVIPMDIDEGDESNTVFSIKRVCLNVLAHFSTIESS